EHLLPCIAVAGFVGGLRKRLHDEGDRKVGAWRLDTALLEVAAWRDREVLLFSSDAATGFATPGESALAYGLARHWAIPKRIRIPSGPDGAKLDVATFLVVHGATALRRLLTEALPFFPCGIVGFSSAKRALTPDGGFCQRLPDETKRLLEWIRRRGGQ